MLNVRFRALTANSKQVRTNLLESQVVRIQRKHAEALKKRMQHYPPPISDTYVRTFDLQRGWRVPPTSNVASGIITILVNDVTYAGFVQGPQQTLIHRGRWLVLSEAVDRSSYHSDLRAMMKGLVIR